MERTSPKRSHLQAAVLAAAAWSLLFAFLPAGMATRALASAVGVGCGCTAAFAVCRKWRRQAGGQGVVVTYVVTPVASALLAVLFVLSQSKFAPLKLAWWTYRHPEALAAAILAAASAFAAHHAWLGLWIRSYERRHGPLRMREFFAPSVTGPQGMIGLEGRVVVPCTPEGKVEVRGELWDAVSLRGVPLAAGVRVVVRDIAELELFVEPVESKTRSAAADEI